MSQPTNGNNGNNGNNPHSAPSLNGNGKGLTFKSNGDSLHLQPATLTRLNSRLKWLAILVIGGLTGYNTLMPRVFVGVQDQVKASQPGANSASAQAGQAGGGLGVGPAAPLDQASLQAQIDLLKSKVEDCSEAWAKASQRFRGDRRTVRVPATEPTFTTDPKTHIIEPEFRKDY